MKPCAGWLPPAAVEAMERAARDLNRYPDGGTYRLHEALAERHGVDIAEIVAGSGADGCIDMLSQAALDPGDEIVCGWPSFPSYVIYARRQGAAAVTVGSKLEELSLNYQVLVISHLPAIAAKAASHFRIEKTERNGRVVTAVRHIESEERVDEIARMLVGEAVTDSARSSAAELLGQQWAGNYLPPA